MIDSKFQSKVSEFVNLFKTKGKNKAIRLVKKELIKKRISWYRNNKDKLNLRESTEVGKAFEILCIKLGLKLEEVSIIEKSNDKIVFRSYNPCPFLEVCKTLNLDTREICKKATEEPVQVFLSEINSKLKFKRNYNKIRPYKNYCEETIYLK